MNQHPRISSAIDRLLTALVVALVLGSALCFGGAVWWFRPAFALLASLLALTMLVRLLLERRMPILKSPLTLLGILALALRVSCSSPRCRLPWLGSYRPPHKRSIRSE